MPDESAAPTTPKSTPDFSLVHATWHYEPGPLDVRRRWLDAASRPDLVEYTVGLDDTDERAVRETSGLLRAVGADEGGRPTAVRNWNGAAALASGRILIVVSDELLPPPDWDDVLLRAIGGLDPTSHAFAVMVRNRRSRWEDPNGPSFAYPWFAHPIVSRAFVDRLGLFDTRFNAVGCDIEFAHRAYWRSVLIDARDEFVLDDRDPGLGHTPSQHRIHSPPERSAANAYLERPVIKVLGRARMRFVRPSGRQLRGGWRLHLKAALNRLATLLELSFLLLGAGRKFRS